MVDNGGRSNPAVSLAKSMWRTVVPQPWRHELRQHRIALATRKLADRQFMELEIFPWLVRSGAKRVLSIGCRNYSAHYERVLARLGIVLMTSDIDPEARRFGAKRHVTADVTLLKPSDFEEPFDAILFNGVIGFGLDEEPVIDSGLAALATLVPAGAPLISGGISGGVLNLTQRSMPELGLIKRWGLLRRHESHLTASLMSMIF